MANDNGSVGRSTTVLQRGCWADKVLVTKRCAEIRPREEIYLVVNRPANSRHGR